MTPFFLQTEVFTKRPILLIVITKWPPIFILSSLKDPLFSLFSLSPKDPYFEGRVRTSPSLPYVSAPPPPTSASSALLGIQKSCLSKILYCIKDCIVSSISGHAVKAWKLLFVFVFVCLFCFDFCFVCLFVCLFVPFCIRKTNIYFIL